jgi:hypothetical protein
VLGRSIAITCVLLALGLTVGTGSALGAKRCGRARLVDGGSAKVMVLRGHVTCAGAGRLIRAVFWASATRDWDGKDSNGSIYWRVRGWRCTPGLGSSQFFCSRGHKEVDGSTRTDDGWSF